MLKSITSKDIEVLEVSLFNQDLDKNFVVNNLKKVCLGLKKIFGRKVSNFSYIGISHQHVF